MPERSPFAYFVVRGSEAFFPCVGVALRSIRWASKQIGSSKTRIFNREICGLREPKPESRDLRFLGDLLFKIRWFGGKAGMNWFVRVAESPLGIEFWELNCSGRSFSIRPFPHLSRQLVAPEQCEGGSEATADQSRSRSQWVTPLRIFPPK